jgi:hypothetical protein
MSELGRAALPDGAVSFRSLVGLLVRLVRLAGLAVALRSAITPRPDARERRRLVESGSRLGLAASR